MELKNFVARVADGEIVPGATYYVYLADTLTLANIYDKDGIAIANPGAASASGQITFAAADGDYDLRVTDGVTLDNVMRVRFSETANTLRADLANSSEPAKGASLVGYDGGTVTDRLRDVVYVSKFGTDTASVQAAFNYAASINAREVVFEGSYTLTNPRNDANFTCAVVVSGLQNCKVRAKGDATIYLDPTGSATPGFGFFRLEQCDNVHFTGLEFDGSAVAVTTGANRLNGIIAVNFDCNNWAVDLPKANRQLEFSRLKFRHTAGGITIARRSMSLADTPMTEGLSVHHCEMTNLLGVDHGVSCPRTLNFTIYSNKFYNEIETVTPQDNMAVDASSGAEVGEVYNNYVRGFVFGMKCESAVNAGPSGTEVRASKRIKFDKNRLEEIGDPTNFVWPGPSGGDTFGIKINGKDCAATRNTIRARTIGVTTGGLSIGLVVVGTHNEDSHSDITKNVVFGGQYGVLHNDTTSATAECSVTIDDNRLQDQSIYGILAQANATITDNRIYRSSNSAIAIQSPIVNTFVRGNFALNCANTNNPVIGASVVFYQEGTGAQGYFDFIDNIIIDTRGASAASYGYFLRAGTVYTNKYVIKPGFVDGLLQRVYFDKYFSAIGESLALDAVARVGPRTIYATNSPAVIAPWNAMPWRVGDRAIFVTPTVGSPKAWVCTVAGTPGTWVSEGNL